MATGAEDQLARALGPLPPDRRGPRAEGGRRLDGLPGRATLGPLYPRPRSPPEERHGAAPGSFSQAAIAPAAAIREPARPVVGEPGTRRGPRADRADFRRRARRRTVADRGGLQVHALGRTRLVARGGRIRS